MTNSDSSNGHFYHPAEERLNVATHLAGLALGIIATIVMVFRASKIGSESQAIFVAVFGTSMIFAYASSTLYHASKNPVIRKRLRILDHIAVYALIAGTYTPFALITLRGTDGWALFIACWTIATAGTIMKLFLTGKFNTFSTILYVVMGWLIVFDVGNLLHKLPLPGVLWLLGGGIAYTLGATLYGLDKLRYNHAAFHCLTLLGSACHVISVTYYVILAE